MKKIKFELKKELHERYVELKKVDKNITLTNLFQKGFNQAIKDIEEELSEFEKSFDHKNDHSQKKLIISNLPQSLDFNGASSRIRTCDPQLRRLLLYPTEL